MTGCTEDSPNRLALGDPDGGPTGHSPDVHDCAEGAECSTGLVCDPLEGCVQCVFDTDCAPTEYCQDRACVDAVACTTHDDCAQESGLPRCDRTADRCVECIAASDCASNEHCIARQCVEYQACVNTFDCAAGTVCDRDAGECVECVTSGDCSETEACWQRTCTPRCTSDNDCIAQSQLCDLGIGACVQCVEHVDCPDVYFCSAGSCFLDTCSADTATCDTDTNEIVTCNTIGNEATRELCLNPTSCQASGDSASCAPWICMPSDVQCSDDRRAVEVCSPDGLSIAATTDCAAGEICIGVACLPETCPAGTTFCDGNERVVCANSGIAEESRVACPLGEYCDATLNACAAQACTPSSTRCQGDAVETCAADGSAYSETTDCTATSQVCDAGACADVVCSQGEQTCTANSVMVCNEKGTGFTLQTQCVVQSFPFLEEACATNGTTASCEPVICTTGQLVCDGETAGVCDATGTGAAPGGQDCAATNQACYGGTCLDRICDPAAGQFCSGASVLTCTNNGTVTSVYDACVTAEYCDDQGQYAYCVTDVCSAGVVGCDGQRSATCNSDGSGYLPGGTDCSLTNSACVSGTCLPIICTANGRYCDQGNVYQCGATGATSSLYATCTLAQHCYASSPTTATCRTDLCTSGSAVCRNNFATTCKSDGSGPEDTGGTDCSATSQACDAGTCKDIVCTPNALFCLAGNVELCNATGTAYSRSDTCTATEFCSPTGGATGQAACAADVCPQGLASCSGEATTTCNADGSGWNPGGTDCSLTSQVCDASVQCAATSVDTIGSSISSASSTGGLRGNYYLFQKNRKLTQIESYATVSGTSLFTWVVYESLTLNGTYNPIFQVATTSSGTAVFHSSGAINVTLQAGRYYLIGVHVAGTHTYFRETLGPTFVSFGQQLEGETVTSTATPTSATFGTDTYVYYQRLTTTVP